MSEDQTYAIDLQLIIILNYNLDFPWSSSWLILDDNNVH